MARARKRGGGTKGRGTNGSMPRLGAFRQAYFGAFCALELEQIGDILRRPAMRELLNRQTRELLEAMLREMGS